MHDDGQLGAGKNAHASEGDEVQGAELRSARDGDGDKAHCDSPLKLPTTAMLAKAFSNDSPLIHKHACFPH